MNVRKFHLEYLSCGDHYLANCLEINPYDRIVCAIIAHRSNNNADETSKQLPFKVTAKLLFNFKNMLPTRCCPICTQQKVIRIKSSVFMLAREVLHATNNNIVELLTSTPSDAQVQRYKYYWMVFLYSFAFVSNILHNPSLVYKREYCLLNAPCFGRMSSIKCEK